MILSADYHTHTPFSHGKNTVLENALVAKEKGLLSIAVSDHGFGHLAYGVKRSKLKALREEIVEAEKIAGVKVLLGVEGNLLSVDGTCDVRERDYEWLDSFLCGYHLLVATKTPADFAQMLVRNSLKIKPSLAIIKRNTKTYINAIKKNPIDAITHLSYRFPCDALEVAKCASDYGTYIEINAQKEHLTDDELGEMVAKTSARFLINSDAHTSARVGDTRLALEQLQRLDFPFERIDNIGGRLPSFRFEEYKKKHC